MRHVVITGGAGFIGAHLARRLLAAGDTVTLVDDFSRGQHDLEVRALAKHPRARLISADLTTPSGWAQVPPDAAIVFHLAAIVGVANVMRAAYAVLDRNMRLTAEAIRYVQAQATPPRFVFLSTSEVYAGSLPHGLLPFPTPETAPLVLPDLAEPRSSYMLSKLYGEAMCRHAGIPFTIVRPHNVYGSRMGHAHVIPQLMRRAHAAPEGGTLTIHSPSHQRTFCHVSDAVRWLEALAQHPDAEGGTFNLGVTQPEVSIAQLADAVCATVGRTLTLVPLDDTPGSPLRRCPDVSRLKGITDGEPRMTLEAGLREMWAWYEPQFAEGRSFTSDPGTDR